jgi:hypothetical protein
MTVAMNMNMNIFLLSKPNDTKASQLGMHGHT